MGVEISEGPEISASFFAQKWLKLHITNEGGVVGGGKESSKKSWDLQKVTPQILGHAEISTPIFEIFHLWDFFQKI